MRSGTAVLVLCVLLFSAWRTTAAAPTPGFLDDLKGIENAHRARWEARLQALDAAESALVLEKAERAGRAIGALSFDVGSTGALRYLGGLDLHVPAAASTADASAYAFMQAHSGLFAIDDPKDLFRVTRTAATPRRIHVHMVQEVEGLPVFGTRVVFHMGVDGGFEGFSGVYLPEKLLPTVAVSVAAAPNARVGLFHGSLFGLHDWESRVAEVAYKVHDVDAVGLPFWRYVSALTGEDLFVAAAYMTDAPSDSYYSPDGATMPGNPVRLDSTQTCGSGVYPSCAWQGTAVYNWFWTNLMGSHLADRYGRDSWDNGQDVEDCPDPHHRMQTTSDYNDLGEWNAVWDPSLCAVGIGTEQATCYDVLGHEFGHGIEQADMAINPIYGRHSSAINEGLADVFGEFYEEWITGDPDWLSGTGTGCQSTRNLANPAESLAPNGDPIAQPEHASQFDPPGCIGACSDHFDATIIGKAAHLLGRAAAEGSITHWGIPVTGIGGTDASLVFYGAVNQYLGSSPTFSDLRDALLDSADEQFEWGSNQYDQTLWTVDAIGFWTHKQDFGFTSEIMPSTAHFTVNGQARRYVFDVEGGSLKYRYRTCTYYGLCTWSAPTAVYSASAGASTVIHDGVLWVFWTYGNGIYYKKYFSDGTSSGVYVRSGASTSVAPVAVHVATNLLYLYYRDVQPLSVAATVRVMQLNGSTWSAATATLVTTRSPFSAISLNNVHLFYRNANLDVAFKRYDRGAGTWSAEHVVEIEVGGLDDAYGPSVAYYRGRIHIAYASDHVYQWSIPLDSSYTASCEYPCMDDAWTPFQWIDGTKDPSTRWSYLFPEDSHLYRADYVPAEGENPAVMTWRWKNSE
jgi:hypothetical protein